MKSDSAVYQTKNNFKCLLDLVLATRLSVSYST